MVKYAKLRRERVSITYGCYYRSKAHNHPGSIPGEFQREGGNTLRRFFKIDIIHWNLDRKIFFLFTSLLYGIIFILSVIFASFYISSFIKQSSNITKNQLSALASNYENTLNSYQELAIALVIDDSIQDFLESGGVSNSKYYGMVNNAKNTLMNAINTHSDMSFIAVISYDFDDILYKGNITKIATNFPKVYQRDYADSLFAYETGTLKMSFNHVYIDENHYTLNVYMPVYSTSNMVHEIGLICMVFDSKIFKGLSKDKIKDFDSEAFMVDGNMRIVSATDFRAVGNKFEYADYIDDGSSNFHIRDDLYNYQKVGKWNYYLVNRIALLNMYRDSLTVVILLVLTAILITFLSQRIFKRVIEKAYQPLEDVVSGMNGVAAGNLDIRINQENVGNDFAKMAVGFNYMMDKINTLMEEVKLEQEQMNQIRFNALQSQIQPHFLYNTLDGIYWQAMAEGNEEISVLVKALAEYYRLCLSKGKDVIPLEKEIEHVKNYLIIQNIRYDNIIESEIFIDEACRKVLIPKITLQPLVENSIYHGIKVKEGYCGKLVIIANIQGDEVVIIVKDNGTGMSKEQIEEMNSSISEYDKDFGYGIRNVNKRIEILFGKEYGLHYEQNEIGGVTVRIHLPCHMTQKYEEVI